MTITTHVLDTSCGRPAQDLEIRLTREEAGGPKELGSGRTNADGRLTSLLNEPLIPGVYRLRFDTRGYFEARGVQGFYPHVEISFQVRDAEEHYHVPLLLNPFGYSTYRGS